MMGGGEYRRGFGGDSIGVFWTYPMRCRVNSVILSLESRCIGDNSIRAEGGDKGRGTWSSVSEGRGV